MLPNTPPGTSTRTRTPKPKVSQDAPPSPARLFNILPSPVIPIAREPHFNRVKEEDVKFFSDANGSSCRLPLVILPQTAIVQGQLLQFIVWQFTSLEENQELKPKVEQRQGK
ncbi:uncharacterized protein LOC141639732 [Silene latifolia]|uniref:uncharacterized protein LOC141639732 n=1 Tax=Silene latifolia TaxID=37657 RepID=UPI003D789884